jgi:hypothetical protein
MIYFEGNLQSIIIEAIWGTLGPTEVQLIAGGLLVRGMLHPDQPANDTSAQHKTPLTEFPLWEAAVLSGGKWIPIESETGCLFVRMSGCQAFTVGKPVIPNVGGV